MPNSLGKICFICYSLRAGGTERVIVSLANNLAERYEVTVVTLSDAVPFYSLDPRVHFIPTKERFSRVGKRTASVLSLIHVRTVVRNVQPGYVCVFGESINAAVLFSLIFVSAKKIVFDRASPMAFRSFRRRIVNPLLYRLADQVVVQTDRARKLAESRYKGLPVDVLGNPVSPLAEVQPIRDRSRTILNIGFLGGKKNQEFLIRCFLRLEEARGWTLEFVGDGPDRKKLETLVVELRGADRVRFSGEIKVVEAKLGNAQVFAFVSKSEGFPNALSEALAAGCACISFDCVAGPSELIMHGKNGLLVPSGNEDEYARQLARLLTDGNLRQHLSENAVVSMDKYLIDRVVERFEEIVFQG